MNSFDFTKYLTHGTIAFAGMAAYDVFIDGKNFNTYALNDAGAFTISSIGSLYASDLLSSVWGGYSNDSIQGMITKPMLSGLFYMYLYDYMVKPNNERIVSRSNTETFLMGGIADVINGYIESPLSSIFGYRTN